MTLRDGRFDDSTIDAVCDCISAAVAMGLPIDDLPPAPADRRERIDRWREVAAADLADPPPGSDRFLAACQIAQSGGGGGDVLRHLTDEPSRRRNWRRRLRPVGAYLIVLWVLGLAVWAFVSVVVGSLLRDANDDLALLQALQSQGGGPPTEPLWILTLETTVIIVAVAAALLLIGVVLWWPLLRRVVTANQTADWQAHDRDRWLVAVLPVGLVLVFGSPLVIAALLTLFVPLVQFYHHLAEVLVS